MNHYSPSYSVILRLRYPDQPGFLGRVASTIGEADGSIGSVDLVQVEEGEITRDIVVSAHDAEHSEQIVERVRAIPGVTVVSVADRTFLLHQGGKIEVALKTPVKTPRRSVDGLYAGRGPRLPAPSRPIPTPASR